MVVSNPGEATHIYAQETRGDTGRVIKGGLLGRTVLGEGETLDG